MNIKLSSPENVPFCCGTTSAWITLEVWNKVGSGIDFLSSVAMSDAVFPMCKEKRDSQFKGSSKFLFFIIIP